MRRQAKENTHNTKVAAMATTPQLTEAQQTGKVTINKTTKKAFKQAMKEKAKRKDHVSKQVTRPTKTRQGKVFGIHYVTLPYAIYTLTQCPIFSM